MLKIFLRTLAFCVFAHSSMAADNAPNNATAMKLTSSAFGHNAAMATKYTCEGADVSPPLSWSGVPQQAKSLVLIVDDPDAPDPAAPQTTWVHWVVYNIPPSASGFAEGVKSLPAGAVSGMNDFEKTSYGGPCPPIGKHRYFYKLYALDIVLPKTPRQTKAQIENAMNGHVIARGELVGTYQKK